MSSDAHLICLCQAFCADLAAHVASARDNDRCGLEIPAWTSSLTAGRLAEITATRASTHGGRQAKVRVIRAYQTEFVPETDMAPDRQLAASVFLDVLGE